MVVEANIKVPPSSKKESHITMKQKINKNLKNNKKLVWSIFYSKLEMKFQRSNRCLQLYTYLSMTKTKSSMAYNFVKTMNRGKDPNLTNMNLT